MRKIFDESSLVQGSDAWISWREKGIGSSEIATIMGLNPYRTREDLLLEKTGQKPREDLSNKYVVKRGTALEPIARNLFNETTNSNFTPVIFQSEEHPFMKYSSDGFDETKDQVIEIKCMGAKNHNKVLIDKTPIDYYVPQIQWALMISGCKSCHFISYNPEFEENLISINVLPNHAFFVQMKEAALKFWDEVQEYLNVLKDNT